MRYCLILFGCCLLLVPHLLTASYYGSGWHGRLNTNLVYEDNISHTWVREDVEPDLIANLEVGGAWSRLGGDSGMWVVDGYFSVAKHNDFKDLDSLTALVNASYLFRIADDFQATTYTVSAGVGRSVFADSDIREGQVTTLKLQAVKRLSEWLRWQYGYEFLQRFARDDTFDTSDHFVDLGLEYDLTPRLTGYVQYRYLKGDLVLQASGFPGTNAATVDADELVFDDVFVNCARDCESWSYRYEGDGALFSLGFVYQIRDELSVDGGWQLYTWETDSGVDYDDSSFQVGITYVF